MTRLGLSLPSTAVLRGRHLPSAAASPPQAEATALLARMAVAPSSERAAAIASLVSVLQGAGIWQKLDALWIMAAHDAQAARLNWVPWTGTVTNMIKNNSMQGAVAGTPGTRPTGWVPPFVSNATGMSIDIASVGAEGGIDYIDYRIHGTPSVDGTVFLYCWGSSTDIPAVPGQIWSGSAHVALKAGSLTGTTWTGGANGLFLYMYNAAIQVTNGPSAPFTPSAGALAGKRVVNPAWATPANTAYVAMAMRFQMTGGVPVDLTLRVGSPQLVMMDVPGDVIRTIGTAASQVQTLNRFDLVAVNSPTFTTDRGYAGNGTSSYLNTRHSPASGIQFQQDNAHLSVWALDNASGDVDIGARSGTGSREGMLMSPSGGVIPIRLNSNTGATPAGTVADRRGLYLSRRQSASTAEMTFNGAVIASASLPSVSPTPYPLYLAALNSAGTAASFSGRRLAAASVGAALSDTELIAFHAALDAYLVSAGAIT